MKLNVFFEKDQVIIKGLEHFEPRHIFECGQSFRWNREEDGSYTGIAYRKILNVKKTDDCIVFKNTNETEYKNIWINYFDLNTDYRHIIKKLSHEDPVMKKAAEFGYGIRILKQEPWETIVSFIISSNNNIPRIKKAVELLCERYGEFIGEYNGEKRYAFPDVKTVAGLSEKELQECNTGYRAAYIKHTASRILEYPLVLNELMDAGKEFCEKQVLSYKGVGPKVAGCILLFCMEKREVFPVDVWVKRVMEHLYFHRDASFREIQQFAQNKFGIYSGFAQQYLFYYAREIGLGRN